MIHFETAAELIEELNLTPSQATLAYLIEERQTFEAEIAALPKKSEKQLFIEAGMKILNSLPPIDQILTKQLHDQGRTQREIATELNISLGTVNKYLKNEQREHARQLWVSETLKNAKNREQREHARQ